MSPGQKRTVPSPPQGRKKVSTPFVWAQQRENTPPVVWAQQRENTPPVVVAQQREKTPPPVKQKAPRLLEQEQESEEELYDDVNGSMLQYYMGQEEEAEELYDDVNGSMLQYYMGQEEEAVEPQNDSYPGASYTDKHPPITTVSFL